MPIKDGLFSKLMEMELGKWSCCSVIDAFHSSGPALNSRCFSPVEQIIYAHINWIKGNYFFFAFFLEISERKVWSNKNMR